MSIPDYCYLRAKNAPRSRLRPVKLWFPPKLSAYCRRLVKRVSRKTGLPAYRASAFVISLLAVSLDGTELDPKVTARFGF